MQMFLWDRINLHGGVFNQRGIFMQYRFLKIVYLKLYKELLHEKFSFLVALVRLTLAAIEFIATGMTANRIIRFMIEIEWTAIKGLKRGLFRLQFHAQYHIRKDSIITKKTSYNLN